MTDTELLIQNDRFDQCVRERDAVLAGKVLHDDYALIIAMPSVAVMPRRRWLEVLPDYVVHSYEVLEFHPDVVADCASVLQRIRMHATVLGQDRSGDIVISDFWLREAGDWRVWRRHSTALSAGRMPGVEV